MDPKQKGRDHYRRKFKKAGKTDGHPPNERIGNTTSLSGFAARCRTGAARTRIVNNMIQKDTTLYNVVDNRPSEQASRKSMKPTIVSYNSSGLEPLNKQRIVRKKRSIKFRPRMVHLNKIHKNLYLCNYDYGSNEENIIDKNYSHIINLSGHKLKNVHNGWNTHHMVNIALNDNRKISTREFKQIMEEVSKVLDNNLNRSNVLLMCNQGTNRSVTAAIYYAITRDAKNYQDVLAYIENKKEKSDYPYWDTLTNNKFKNLLLNIQQVSGQRP